MAITSINLGKIKFNWKGIWQQNTVYVKDDVIRYNGSSYVCTIGHTSSTSYNTHSSKWDLMAEGTTPTTTQGDLIYRSSSQDARLPIGNSGQVLTVESGLPIWKDSGVNDKIFYVSPDGSDSNSGQSWGTSFATIKYACTQATGPATIRVASGSYSEALPITVPSFVAVVGDNQRTTIVGPASGYEQATMWKLSDGALLNKMCFVGLTGYIPYAPDDKNITLATIGGVYVAFNSASPIATKSPYIIECTAKSAGGVGALLDGALHASGNKSMVFHGFTVILDSGVGYWIKDNAKSEIVSCFTYFCHMGYVATGGGKIRALNGNNSYGTYGALASGYNSGEATLNGSLYGNQLEYTAVSLTGGSFTAGETITGGTSGATGVIQNVQAGVNKLYYKIATGGPFQVGETISNGAGVTAVIATGGVSGQKGFVLVVTGLSSEPKPGGSIEFTSGDTFTYVIQSVTGWINSSSKAVIVLAGEKVAASLDGANIRIRYDYSNIRLTGHDFLSIGTGGVTTTNYPGIPLQDSAQGNEVVELFPARVFYVSTDQDGNFRVGEYFKVDQATGRATLNASAFDLSGLTSLKLGSIGAQLGELVNEFSSDETLSGNSNSAVPTEKATKQYFTKVSSNVIPAADDLYTLGTPSKRWNHLYVGPGTITIGTLTISDNAGTLEVKSGASAAPTLINAINNGTSNVSVTNNGNVTIAVAGGTQATFSTTGTTIAGDLAVNGATSADITTTTTTATVFDTTATTVYLGRAATTLTMGASSGTTTIRNDVTISGSLTVSGSQSYIQGTNTVYTDSLIELHAPSGGVGGTWSSSDGYDIGLRLHYYNSGDKNAAFVFDAATQNFEFFSDGTETSGTFTGTFGKTKTGGTILVGATSGTTTLQASGVASGTLTLPAATDTLIGKATTDTLTNKTYDTAGTGNTFRVNGTALSAVTGTGAVVLATSPQITTSLTTDSSSFDLINTTATTVNFAKASTTLSIGAGTGTTTVNNTLSATSPAFTTSITTPSTTFALVNGTATTINFGGVATALNIGGTAASASTLTFGSSSNSGNTLQINSTTGGTVNLRSSVTTGAVNIFADTTTGTVTVGSAAAGKLTVAFNSASTSTSTGALVVTGGAGVGGSLYATTIYENTARVATMGKSIAMSMVFG